MASRTALSIIMGVAGVGMLFSGFLTYRELFSSSAQTCSVLGQPGTIFGYPACVYGLIMYLIVFAVASWGLMRSR